MTLNFSDALQNFQLIGLLILVAVFAFMAVTQTLLARHWKKRYTYMATDRDFLRERSRKQNAEIDQLKIAAVAEKASRRNRGNQYHQPNTPKRKGH